MTSLSSAWLNRGKEQIALCEVMRCIHDQLAIVASDDAFEEEVKRLARHLMAGFGRQQARCAGGRNTAGR